MTLLRKSILSGVLLLALLIFGFIFLLKGCLAKYDERFIHAPALLFEKNGKAVVFSIVEFQKTTSYSRNGGFVRRSVNTSYYVQLNDAETADEIKNVKVKKHRQVKSFPVEVLGASGDHAWIFMGEPMAFDAWSLSKFADISILEEKNPSLKGRFPAEKQFYNFSEAEQALYFTATDGSKWKLNTVTLAATASDYKKGNKQSDIRLKALETELMTIRSYQDSLYQQKNYRASRDYSDKKISYDAYRQITNEYYAERSRLDKLRDSLQTLKYKLEASKREADDHEREIEQLQRSNISFSQIKQNQDTLNGTWYGMYTEEELDKLSDRVSDQAVYDETVRRKLYSGTYSYNRNGDAVINKKETRPVSQADFLAGGLLISKSTARPVVLPGGAFFLVVHKQQLGREGMILVSKLGLDGKLAWVFNTGLTEWADWKMGSNRLYIFGVSNKELSSSECNLLHCINLDNGRAASFDYFKNKRLQ
jgi:hypothetical protein